MFPHITYMVLQGSGPALGGSNALARVIERLEAGYVCHSDVMQHGLHVINCLSFANSGSIFQITVRLCAANCIPNAAAHFLSCEPYAVVVILDRRSGPVLQLLLLRVVCGLCTITGRPSIFVRC